MHLDALYFIILPHLMPDDFTCQGESAATGWGWIKSNMNIQVISGTSYNQ